MQCNARTLASCQLALRTACWINIHSQDRNILPLDYMHSSLFSHFILAWNLFLCLREYMYWEVPWGFALLWWGCIDKQGVSSRLQHSISLLDEFLDHRMIIRFRSIKMVNNLLWWGKKAIGAPLLFTCIRTFNAYLHSTVPWNYLPLLIFRIMVCTDMLTILQQIASKWPSGNGMSVTSPLHYSNILHWVSSFLCRFLQHSLVQV